MPEYVCEGPNYRMFPYEQRLSLSELAALTGQVGERQNGHVIVKAPREVPRENLRRLAFTSRVVVNGTSFETDVARLEASSLRARYGTVDTSRKESNYLTHGLHKFKGKFYPQLVRALLNMGQLEPGRIVLDPFCGSGTTLVEAWLTGVHSLGFDVSPLAQRIASAKVAMLTISIDKLDSGLAKFERHLARACANCGLEWSFDAEEEPRGDATFDACLLASICGVEEAGLELDRWFAGAVRHKLAAIVKAIRSVGEKEVRDFLWIVLSDCVRSVSQQEPRDLRIRKRAVPLADAPLLSILRDRIRLEQSKLAEGLRGWRRRKGIADPFAIAELLDVRCLDQKAHHILGSRLADAVVTSPPYATALPYIDTDRLSFLVLGLATRKERSRLENRLIGSREVANPERLRLEAEMEGGGLRALPRRLGRDLSLILRENRRGDVGFRRRNMPALLYRYFRDMGRCLERIAESVRPGGKLFFVVGDSRTKLGNDSWFKIRTCTHILDLAESAGLQSVDQIPITVTTEDLAHSRNAITENEILIFRRP